MLSRARFLSAHLSHGSRRASWSVPTRPTATRTPPHSALRGCSQPDAGLDPAPHGADALDTGFASSSTETPAARLWLDGGR